MNLGLETMGIKQNHGQWSIHQSYVCMIHAALYHRHGATTKDTRFCVVVVHYRIAMYNVLMFMCMASVTRSGCAFKCIMLEDKLTVGHVQFPHVVLSVLYVETTN